MEIKKSQSKENKTDWAYILDLFASEYGWKTDDVLNLTMKEVAWRIDAIAVRKKKDMELKAKLHGLEYKGKPTIEDGAKIDDRAKEVFDKLIARGKHG